MGGLGNRTAECVLSSDLFSLKKRLNEEWISLGGEENCLLEEGKQREIPYITFLNRSAHNWDPAGASSLL